MGLILDSSVVIAAERRGDTVDQLIGQIMKATDDQEAALSAIGLTELIHVPIAPKPRRYASDVNRSSTNCWPI
jgi:hypothetical protein